uniref:Uncharacterized protein n=1 Tax=Anguilla anguilla TaxID=7936 RepID=A0A0E9UHM8_ANGAN
MMPHCCPVNTLRPLTHSGRVLRCATVFVLP